MRNWIASYYIKKLKQKFDKTFWESLFISYIDKKTFPKQKLKLFIEQEFSTDFEDPLSFYKLLKKFFSLIFYTRLFPYSYEDLLVPLFKKIMQKKYTEDYQPIFALQNLICYLITLHFEKITPKYLADGMTFFSANDAILSLQLPDIRYNLELAMYWKIFAILQNDEKLTEGADHILSWHLNWLDHEDRPIYTLWSSPEKESNLLFSFLTKKEIKLDLPEKLPFFLIAISLLYDEVFANFSKQSSFMDRQLAPLDKATLLYQKGDGKCVFTLRGINTGLGYIQKDAFSILSFGPHGYPIENKYDFGIFRTDSLHRQQFENVIKTKESLSGWAPLCLHDFDASSFDKPSKTWMYMQALVVAEDIWKLSIRFMGLQLQDEVGFCFFIRALSSFFNQIKIYPRDSKKISTHADTIFFYTLSKKIIFKSKASKKMIIDTKKQYWDEDFFLTYIIRGDEPTLNVEIQVSN